MKILVCTDGSEQSEKALRIALKISVGPNVEEVAVIHVFDSKLDLTSSAWIGEGYTVTEEDMAILKKRYEEQKEEKNKMLDNARQLFADKNVRARAIMKDGHPSDTIVKIAEEEGFDIIVTGSRGLGGLKKMLLGSVSNAIVQEAKNCSVLVVK